MSKADEMFKELGYIKEESDYSIRYIKPLFEGIGHRISFYKLSKMVDACGKTDMQQLQAINEKCKELGWFIKS